MEAQFMLKLATRALRVPPERLPERRKTQGPVPASIGDRRDELRRG